MSEERRRRPTPKTSHEVNSELMRDRLLQHIENWYEGYRQKSPPDLSFVANDGDLQLWRCSLIPPNAPESETEDKWLFWDTKEVESFPSADYAFREFISVLKGNRIDGKFQYFTSPLTISAILALLMLGLIMGLLLFKAQVPDQLWSVFTAVVAFYFGRESGGRADTGGRG